MSEFDRAMRNIEDPQGDGSRKSGRLKEPSGDEVPIRRIVVNKRTHRVHLENETESEVTVVIEEKGGGSERGTVQVRVDVVGSGPGLRRPR